MPTYFSEVDHCWYECEVLSFTGPKATHTLIDGEGHVQREIPMEAKRAQDPETMAAVRKAAKAKQEQAKARKTETCRLCGKLLPAWMVERNAQQCKDKPQCIRRQRHIETNGATGLALRKSA